MYVSRRMNIKALHRILSRKLNAGQKGELLTVTKCSERDDIIRLKNLYDWDIKTERTDKGFRVIAA